MAETYHEDLEHHLQEQRARAQAGINALFEIVRHGDRYKADERRKLVTEAKASCGHDPCPVADGYKGNPRPVVPGEGEFIPV